MARRNDWIANHRCTNAWNEWDWLHAKSWPNGCSILFCNGSQTRLAIWCALLWRKANWLWLLFKLSRLAIFCRTRTRKSLNLQLTHLVQKVWSIRFLYQKMVSWTQRCSRWIYSYTLGNANEGLEINWC